MAKMRAKFQVNEIVPDSINNEDAFTLKMSPVTTGCEENKTFNKYTPAGELTMFIDSPSLMDTFKVGEEYYLDFTKAEKE